ncbi:hypothetical protein [Streptomyces sp. NPDC056244]|uniref:hypothetical protein n=1 Tax=Streptomyces sp. NPDC056244 TaxID=3345762 RepID=UPI0035D906BC
MTELRSRALLTAAALTALALTGCSMTESDEPKIEGTRSVDAVDAEAKRISSQVLDIIAVKGEVSEPGPGVGTCAGLDRDKYFTVRHPWSLTAATDAELAQAMTRLKEGLPEQGWKITQYGRNNSPAKSLELTADHTGKKFGVNVEFWEKGTSGNDNPPSLVVTVVSGCFQVPEGEKVKHY